jgi:hypothetical protein
MAALKTRQSLQRKVAAYRQLQNAVTAELYGVSSALVSRDEPTLEATLRQLNQFGYDFDHLQSVATWLVAVRTTKGESAPAATARQDHQSEPPILD